MNFEYVIGDKKYVQKPLVLGQIRQLLDLTRGIKIPRKIDTKGIISLLGKKLPEAMAIIITPEGTNLKDKNIETFASEIEFELSPDQVIQVIEDFFSSNPIASLLDKLAGMAEKIKTQMNKTTGLKKSSASSQQETSQKETISSGDTR